MVGSLLVGRQIVDRAKIQRIIFEFDYYEKAFHQFYDTYRVVPGNLICKIANKYSNLQPICSDRTTRLPDISVGTKIIGNNWRCPMGVAGQLCFARLLPTQLNKSCISYFETGMKSSPLEGQNQADKIWFLLKKHNFVEISYGDRAHLAFFGYEIKKWTSLEDHKKYMYPGSSTYFNGSYPHEFDNQNFLNSLNGHNTITALRMKDDDANIVNGRYVTTASSKASTAFLTAKLTSELDAKIDDGRPGSGRILAMKSIRAHDENTSNSKHLTNCYDKMANEVDKAIYHSSTNFEDGCNITYIMEDVK